MPRLAGFAAPLFATTPCNTLTYEERPAEAGLSVLMGLLNTLRRQPLGRSCRPANTPSAGRATPAPQTAQPRPGTSAARANHSVDALPLESQRGGRMPPLLPVLELLNAASSAPPSRSATRQSRHRCHSFRLSTLARDQNPCDSKGTHERRLSRRLPDHGEKFGAEGIAEAARHYLPPGTARIVKAEEAAADKLVDALNVLTAPTA